MNMKTSEVNEIAKNPFGNYVYSATEHTFLIFLYTGCDREAGDYNYRCFIIARFSAALCMRLPVE